MAATALSQHQHIFLQTMLANRVMRYDIAKQMHVEIVNDGNVKPSQQRAAGNDDNREFDKFWSEVARALGYLDLDLRRVKWPEDNQLYLGVINKTGGDTAKLATKLTPEQIALFRVMVDEILKDDRNAEQGVDVMSALNVTQLWSQAAAGGGGAGGSQLPNGTQAALTQEQQESVAKMSKVDKEQTLRLLCVDGWLTQGDDDAGKLRLGVRAFLELRDFLLSAAPPQSRARWEKML